MLNVKLNSKLKNIYDLSERTAVFGENVLKFVKKVKETTITKPLISQLVRSATSVGANYMEADCGESKKDFNHKIGICRKESKETMHWFRMLSVASPDCKDDCRILWKEAKELLLIFSAILRKRVEKDL